MASLILQILDSYITEKAPKVTKYLVQSADNFELILSLFSASLDAPCVSYEILTLHFLCVDVGSPYEIETALVFIKIPSLQHNLRNKSFSYKRIVVGNTGRGG